MVPQAIVITDPFLLQEFFAAERAGAFEKPNVRGFGAGFKDKVSSWWMEADSL